MRKRVVRAVANRWVVTAFLSTCIVGGIGHMSFGCSGWDPTRPFEKNNPDVDRAIEMIEAGQYENAEEVLTDFLDTGKCDKGKINLGDRIKQKPDGAFDLGLVLFYLGEKYGERFGDEKKMVETQPETVEDLDKMVKVAEGRVVEIKCGLLVALAIAKDPRVPTELRARAFYLAGNLEFLRLNYKAAIAAYDESLRQIPGIVEEAGGDGIGRDAAWNRAVALRRLEEQQEDAGDDAGDEGDQGQQPQPQPQDGGKGDQDQDGGEPNEPDGDLDGGGNDSGDKDGDDAGDAGEKPDSEGPDGGKDAGPDAGNDDGAGEPDAGDKDPQNGDPNQDPKDDGQLTPDPEPKQPNAQGPDSASQGDRILDRFDQTPSYQQEEAKKRAEGRRRTEDK